MQYTDWAEDGRLADGLADLVRKAALVARSHHDDLITMIASLLCHVTVAAASLSLLRHRARAVVQRLGQLDLTGGLGLTKLDHRFLNKVLCRVIGRPDPLLQSLFIRTYLTVWARAASPLLPGEEVSAGQCQRHSNGAVCADLLVQEDESEDESDGWVASRQCGHGRRRADRQGFGVQSGGLQPALS